MTPGTMAPVPVLVVSADHYNEHAANIWCVDVGELPFTHQYVIPLTELDPMAGSWIYVHRVVRVPRSWAEQRLGRLSGQTLERARRELRDILDL